MQSICQFGSGLKVEARSIDDVATQRKQEREPSPLDKVLDEEVAEIFAADPEFKADLEVTIAQVRRGEAKLVADSDVRSRLNQLGVALEPDSPDSPPATSGA